MASTHDQAEGAMAKAMFWCFRQQHRRQPHSLGADGGCEAGPFLGTFEEDLNIRRALPSRQRTPPRSVLRVIPDTSCYDTSRREPTP